MKDIKEYVAEQKNIIKSEMQVAPTFCIFQVGNNEASNRYVRNKIKDCESVGIKATLNKVDEGIDFNSLAEMIKQANNEFDAIMLQLPLPDHLKSCESDLTELINPEKDVDGLTTNSKFKPCTPKGIMDYLDANNYDFDGKNAVVIGRSNIVGKPIARMLLDRNCSVTVIHSKTKPAFKRSVLNEADLVICAAGKHGVIHPAMAPHAFIVDVGINFNEEGKLVGDVEIVQDKERARVTPVPGGVGLLTRLALLKNIIACKELKSI